jgi:hypothetical protein
LYISLLTLEARGSENQLNSSQNIVLDLPEEIKSSPSFIVFQGESIKWIMNPDARFGRATSAQKADFSRLHLPEKCTINHAIQGCPIDHTRKGGTINHAI